MPNLTWTILTISALSGLFNALSMTHYASANANRSNTSASTTLMTQRQDPQNTNPSATQNQLDSLVSQFQNDCVQQDNGNCDFGEQGPKDICLVSPSGLSNGEVWSTRPLVLWQRGSATQVSQVSIMIPRTTTEEQVWSQPVEAGTQSVIYRGAAELQPGQRYTVKITHSGSKEPEAQIFRIVAADRRNKIMQDILALQTRLRNNRASAEAIAINKADYFLKQNLKSDALQMLFSIQNPSEAVLQARQQILASLCNSQDDVPSEDTAPTRRSPR